jgi:hypothetical protein
VLRAIFAPGLSINDVKLLLESFISRARRRRLQPFVRLAATIHKHRDEILTAIALGVTNARAEAFNNEVRLIVRRAYGFHSPQAALALIMLACGPVDRAGNFRTAAELNPYVSRLPSGLHVLGSPRDFEQVARLGPDRYGELVAFLSCFYEVVLLDLGTGVAGPLARFAIERADQVVLVTTPEWVTTTVVLEALKHLQHDRTTVALNKSMPNAADVPSSSSASAQRSFIGASPSRTTNSSRRCSTRARTRSTRSAARPAWRSSASDSRWPNSSPDARVRAGRQPLSPHHAGAPRLTRPHTLMTRMRPSTAEQIADLEKANLSGLHLDPCRLTASRSSPRRP